MAILLWILSQKDWIEALGVIGALMISVVQLGLDSRVRRAETLIDISRDHRELQFQIRDNPRLSRLFDPKRDLAAHPLTDDEVHFMNLEFLHLRATFYAEKAGIYVQPEFLSADIQEILSLPAPKAAWERLKPLHDLKFVSFVEQIRKSARLPLLRRDVRLGANEELSRDPHDPLVGAA